jgi:predicted TIM-barrel fold metal-dependent hydrolase
MRSTIPTASGVPGVQGILPKSWDSHMHVVDPGRYPLAPDAAYTPSPHTLPEALAFESSVGISNIVLVQPSIYGIDNSCLLDALRDIGPRRGRAVVSIDPEAPPRSEELKQWHALGVRGVRLNLQSVGRELSPEELEVELRRYADVVRPLGWVLQLYVSMGTMPALEKIVPQLGVKVCFDHFGSPDLSQTTDTTVRKVKAGGSGFDPYSLEGFSAMVSMLRQGNVYVKISAPYRLSKDPEMRDLQAITKELIRVAGNRLVFATDWPHTRFEEVDIEPFMKACLEWCADSELKDMLFRRNAEDLWDAEIEVGAQRL